MVLSGRCGTILNNGVSAVVVVEPFVFVGGVADEQLAAEMRAGQIVVGPRDNWIQLLTKKFPRSTPIERQLFDGNSLDRSHLAQFLDGFDIHPVNAELAQRLNEEIDEDLVLFPGPFAVDGVGFCAFSKNTLVAAATSGLWSDTEIEIQVNTVAASQRKGFAAAVSAALIIECLTRKITPSWETQDATSARLAERLGYLKAGTYEWLELG